ncbi:MAG: CRISPR-associated endonuclease Cas2 [Candidatus Omnitrophica bacterium]|nr:CRISPR-associated endonuclease Cas2 [Candidatus Omnitrophota bacterium]
MFLVLSYDIEDDKRRVKVAQKLEDYGTRVQFSVFECILDENKTKELLTDISELIKEGDSFRCYCLCEGCLKKIKVYGATEITREQEVYII